MPGLYVFLAIVLGLASALMGGLAAGAAGKVAPIVAAGIAIAFGLASIGMFILAAWEDLSEKISRLPKK